MTPGIPLLAALVVASAPAVDGKLDAFLARPLETFRADGVAGGFRVVALSNLAEVCASFAKTAPARLPEARRCTARLVEIALDRRVSPYGGPPPKALGQHNLYLSHLAIVLAANRAVSGDATRDALHRRIVEHLAQATLAEPTRHLRSYPDAPGRWPADQAATLYAVFLYDRLHGTALHEEPARAWLASLRAHATDAKSQLPYSEVSGSYPTSKLPRGCALSWTVRYLAAFAPDEAKTLWGRYKARHLASYLVMVGFREWPPGVERAGDLDSGPIVHGLGVAATAFAVGASRAVGDTQTHLQLVTSEDAVRLVVQSADPRLARLAGSILAHAISTNGRTAARWWE